MNSDSSYNVWVDVAIAVIGGGSLLIQSLGLYIIKDLRDRIVRLEDKVFDRLLK
jgi:hypothetical protein